MGFAYRQQVGVTSNGTNLTSISATLPSTPLPGSLVLFCLFTPEFYNGLVVQDDNGNRYVETPNSQAATTTCYLVSAPINATAHVTATWTSPSSTYLSLQIYEFIVTGGSAYFDSDASSNGTLSGFNLNLPVIPVRGPNELLFGQCAVAISFTSPLAGQVQNGWTGLGLTGNGDCPEYIIAASSNTAVSATGNTSGDTYHSLGVSFGFTPTQVPHQASNYGFKGMRRFRRTVG